MIDKTIGIEDQGSYPQRIDRAVPVTKTTTVTLRIEAGYSARHAAGLTRSSKGFSLISAIFLLVVIAALGAFAVTLSTSQQQSAALDVMGARAYQAARAGIEWGAYRVLRNGGACAATTPLPVLPGTLSGFNVNVACTSASASEAAATVTLYQLVSRATQGTVGTPNYVERQISVSIAPQ